jgi:hexosaminidase
MLSPTPTLLPRPRRMRFDGAHTTGEAIDLAVSLGASLPPEGYRLTILPNGAVRVEAADDAGAFYAQRSLDQLYRRAPDGRVPVGEIEDWPDLPVRGVMLDVSRCKVPELGALQELVDRLAMWKVNHLELYLEHTFAYPGHDVVWAHADPYDAGDMQRLRVYCAARHVDLVANQNSLGHMERWLLHRKYAPLGIARGVQKGPFGLPFPPSTLDPASPAAFDLLDELLTTITAALPGRRLHVGLDEPWDLPSARSGEWRSWLDRLRAMPALAGRELLVWGDMLAAHPELLERWPADVTVCEWGYEDNHPFGDRTGRLASLGVPHWVSPGTSSWMSIVGRTTNAIDNSRGAVSAARQSGAGGMLVTDWGDWGHLQPPVVSDPGFAAAASMAWCFDTNHDLDADAIARALDVDCYGDARGELGTALVALGGLHRRQPCLIPNLSPLVLPLYLPQLPAGPALDPGLTSVCYADVAAALDDAVAGLRRASPTTAHGRRAVDDLVVAAALVRLALDDGQARAEGDGHLASIPERRRLQLADGLSELIRAHRERWIVANRPGGLDESCRWLTHTRDCYQRGDAGADWAGPVVEQVREMDLQ